LARPRSPNRDIAKRLWLGSGKHRPLKDIAQELQISEEQVRKWKNQDKWDKVTLPNVNSNVTNQKGGQPGNKNAAGHGGTGPPRNKNAIKTGEFETLFFDVLEPDERELAKAIEPDKERLLLQEIQLLTVRERRMLQRIEQLKHTEPDPEKKILKGMSVTKFEYGLQRGEPTALKEYQDNLDRIQSIEEALTRVQARKQKAIEALHRFGFDDARLELETLKFEMAMLKQGDQGEDTGDDGFLDAMNATAAEIWGDADV